MSMGSEEPGEAALPFVDIAPPEDPDAVLAIIGLVDATQDPHKAVIRNVTASDNKVLWSTPRLHMQLVGLRHLAEHDEWDTEDDTANIELLQRSWAENKSPLTPEPTIQPRQLKPYRHIPSMFGSTKRHSTLLVLEADADAAYRKVARHRLSLSPEDTMPGESIRYTLPLVRIRGAHRPNQAFDDEMRHFAAQDWDLVWAGYAIGRVPHRPAKR